MKHQVTAETKNEETAQLAEGTSPSTEAILEFESVERAIRHDAAGIVVPPGLRDRVFRELGTPGGPRPWWKRWIR
ncbi:MAG: hypothetical protein ACKV19_23965 [Verrucomicrobiales bacterium]